MNWPLTRMAMRSGPAWTTPEGATAFCAASVAIDLLEVEPERRDLAGREFEIDRLVLRAEEIDLPDIGHGQDFRARVLDAVAQLAIASGRRGEGVDVAVDVAEAVVEERTLHAARETGP